MPNALRPHVSHAAPCASLPLSPALSNAIDHPPANASRLGRAPVPSGPSSAKASAAQWSLFAAARQAARSGAGAMRAVSGSAAHGASPSERRASGTDPGAGGGGGGGGSATGSAGGFGG